MFRSYHHTLPPSSFSTLDIRRTIEKGVIFTGELFNCGGFLENYETTSEGEKEEKERERKTIVG